MGRRPAVGGAAGPARPVRQQRRQDRVRPARAWRRPAGASDLHGGPRPHRRRHPRHPCLRPGGLRTEAGRRDPAPSGTRPGRGPGRRPGCRRHHRPAPPGRAARRPARHHAPGLRPCPHRDRRDRGGRGAGDVARHRRRLRPPGEEAARLCRQRPDVGHRIREGHRRCADRGRGRGRRGRHRPLRRRRLPLRHPPRRRTAGALRHPRRLVQHPGDLLRGRRRPRHRHPDRRRARPDQAAAAAPRTHHLPRRARAGGLGRCGREAGAVRARRRAHGDDRRAHLPRDRRQPRPCRPRLRLQAALGHRPRARCRRGQGRRLPVPGPRQGRVRRDPRAQLRPGVDQGDRHPHHQAPRWSGRLGAAAAGLRRVQRRTARLRLHPQRRRRHHRPPARRLDRGAPVRAAHRRTRLRAVPSRPGRQRAHPDRPAAGRLPDRPARTHGGPGSQARLEHAGPGHAQPRHHPAVRRRPRQRPRVALLHPRRAARPAQGAGPARRRAGHRRPGPDPPPGRHPRRLRRAGAGALGRRRAPRLPRRAAPDHRLARRARAVRERPDVHPRRRRLPPPVHRPAARDPAAGPGRPPAGLRDRHRPHRRVRRHHLQHLPDRGRGQPGRRRRRVPGGGVPRLRRTVHLRADVPLRDRLQGRRIGPLQEHQPRLAQGARHHLRPRPVGGRGARLDLAVLLRRRHRLRGGLGRGRGTRAAGGQGHREDRDGPLRPRVLARRAARLQPARDAPRRRRRHATCWPTR